MISVIMFKVVSAVPLDISLSTTYICISSINLKKYKNSQGVVTSLRENSW